MLSRFVMSKTGPISLFMCLYLFLLLLFLKKLLLFCPDQRGEALVAQWTRRSARLPAHCQGFSGDVSDPAQRVQGQALSLVSDVLLAVQQADVYDQTIILPW